MTLNLPNKLTILRIALIPFFVFAYLTTLIPAPFGKYLALLIFIVASYTDHLDGKIARSRGIVTNFGKFIDPLADKLLVSSAFLCFVERGIMPAWIAIILIGREFVISGFRLLASDKGIVIAAGIWGKLKTVVQMVMIIFILVDFGTVWSSVISQILMYISMVLSLISCYDYIANNKEVLKN